MHSFHSFFLFFFLFSLSSSRLLNVIQLNRHGARTPTNYKNGPLSKYFGANMKLTPNGFRQHQILGQFIHEKYITKLHFLSEIYKKSQFNIYTTETQRTIFSAEGFISGLYPGSIVRLKYDNRELDIITNDTVPFLFNFIPGNVQRSEIELKVIDMKKDVMFHPFNCKLKGVKLKSAMKDGTQLIFDITEGEIKESIGEIANFLNVTLNESVAIKAKEKMSELQKLFFVYSYHFNKQWENLSPKAKILMRKMVLNKWYSTRTKETKFLKLGVSGIFDKILSIFESAKKKTSFLKKDSSIFTVYSTHDTTLVNILSNLIDTEILKKQVLKALNDDKIFNFLVPPFASSIIFELHSDDSKENEFYVKIYYNGELLEKNIKGVKDSEIKEGKIPYNKFLKLFKNSIDYDYKKLDCSEEKEKKESDDSLFSIN